MPTLEDVGTFDFSNKDEDDGEMANMNSLDTTIQGSPTPTKRIHKDHPLDQVIGDLHSATQTRNMIKNLEEHGFVSTIQQRTNHKDLQNCLFAWFLLQEEPKKKFGFIEVKNASTPIETQKPLLKDKDGEEVDVHMYRSVIGSLTYLTSSRLDIMFAVDGKEIIITESSVRRDLRLADEEGVDCFLNSTIFENLELMGKPKRNNTQVPQPSDSIEHVADEAVYKELDDRLVRAATTTSSLEAEQDSGNIDKTQSKATPNEANSPRTTLGGDPRCQDTMGDTIAQTRFENMSKHSNDSLLARARVDSSKDEQSLGEDAYKHGRKIDDIDADEDITLFNDQDDAEMFDVNDLHGEEVSAAGEVNDAYIATTVSAAATITTEEITLTQALVKIKTSKPKAKEIVFKSQLKKKYQIRLDEKSSLKLQAMLQAEFDKEERIAREKAKKELEANIALIKEWDDIQAKINADYQLAKRLQTEEQEELTIEEKATLFKELLKKRRKHFAAKAIKEKRNKPPTQAQQRKIMCTYLKNMEGKKLKDLKNKSFDSIQKMFDRAFNRMEDLYNLVKAKYGSTRPVEDLDLLLWGDLKTMFELHVEDQVWKKQHVYRVLE
nr:hypothetical protein [Tanacetum cinerariifolium]